MGYSIAIRVKSEKTHPKFLAFMKQNFRPWNVLRRVDPSEWQGSAGDPTDALSYGGAKRLIGFDYQSGMYGFERDYIYSMIRWMALKVGDRKKQMVVDKTDKGSIIHSFSNPTPYYIYDGEETLNPIIVVEGQELTLSEGQQFWAVDEWGIRVGPTAVDSHICSCTELIGELMLGNQGPDFRKETEAIRGTRPPEGEANKKVWFAKRREIYLKYLAEEINKNIGLIRQEVQRLDQLWAKEA